MEKDPQNPQNFLKSMKINTHTVESRKRFPTVCSILAKLDLAKKYLIILFHTLEI